MPVTKRKDTHRYFQLLVLTSMHPLSYPLSQLAFYCCEKDHNQKQPGDGWVYLAYKFWNTVHGGKPKQELSAVNVEEKLLTALLLLACSICFFIQPKTTCPGRTLIVGAGSFHIK